MIKWFKELFTLIKWLYTSRPSDYKGKEMEIVIMKYFPFPTSRYMSWCGRIITRAKKKDLFERFLKTVFGMDMITHENGHKIQAIEEHGDNWIRYYWMYFIHWMKHNPLFNGKAAYYCNRYEVEAYAQESYPDYWANYTRKNLKGKYSIKRATRIYKKLGSSRKWKQYIKNL